MSYFPGGAGQFGSTNVVTTGSMTAGSFIGASLDAASGTLALGTTSASQVNIGRSGFATFVLGSLTVNGDFVVNGTTVTVNSTVVDVADRVLHVNHTTANNTPVPSNIAGWSVHRGNVSGVDRDHAGLFWDEANQQFVLAFNTGGNDTTLGADVKLKIGSLRVSGLSTGLAHIDSSGNVTSSTISLNSADTSGTLPIVKGGAPAKRHSFGGLQGVVASTARSTEPQVVARAYFDPTLLQAAGTLTRKVYFRVIVETSDATSSVNMDLFDSDGITGAVQAIASSVVTSSSLAPVRIEQEVTGLAAVSTAGILTLRIWGSNPGLGAAAICSRAVVEVDWV